MTAAAPTDSDATGFTADSADSSARPGALVRHFVIEDELSVRTRQQLKLRVVDALAEGATSVILNASSCGYIDTSGLGVLVSINKKCRDAGATMVLEHLNAEMRVFLAHVKLDTVLPIVPPITDDERMQAP
jgi:anti-sigma B factor antagonist